MTDGDFKRKIIQYNNLLSKKITDVMTKNLITITKDMFIIDAIKIMKNGIGKNNTYIQILPVVEKNKLIGLLHIQDCLKKGLI